MDDDLFVVDQIDSYRSICISTLSRSTVDDAGVVQIFGDKGYFIYEIDRRAHSGGIHVLAKASSIEAAMRLIEVWQMRGASTEAALTEG